MSIKETWALYGLIVPFGLICVALMGALIAKTDRQQWLPAVGWTLLTLGSVFVIGLAFDWLPSTPNEVEYDQFLLTNDPAFIVYCEGYEPASWIQQPISTWSNLAFVAAGLLTVLIVGTRPAPAPNIMADRASVIPLVFGLLIIFMGPGSMYFHGSMKIWGGWFDNLSIFMWAALGLSYSVTRVLMVWFKASRHIVWVFWLVISAAAGTALVLDPTAHRITQVAVVGAWVVIELLIMIAAWMGRPPGFRRSTGWAIATLVAFVIAFAVWIPSGAITRSWCDPLSPIQGHGFWHLFAAIGALLSYCYLASETEIVSQET